MKKRKLRPPKKINKKKIISRTKVILYIIIVVFALISITATYAWFSLHRKLYVIGFNVRVEVAESLEISLDGDIWTHSINIEDMRQLYGTYRDRDQSTVALQANQREQRNYIPIEMLPVSTVGNIENGNLVFVTGKLKNNKLTNIKKCSEADITMGANIGTKEDNNDKHPYLAFDIYLRNLSRLTENGREDPLQLNEGTTITANEEGTGLEYSTRVAFVKYDQTVDLTAPGFQARAIRANGNESVAIYEPNYKGHTAYTVKNDKRLISTVQEIDTYAIKDNVGGRVPTELEDITDSTNPALEKVYTNKAEQAEERNMQIPGTTKIQTLKEIDGTTEFGLKPNQTSKVRVYIWIEGQDPDCIDLSSTGKQINATIRLIKPEYRQLITNTYK